MLRNILFDLDGTLTDPAEGITKSICYALEKMGHPPPDPSTLNWAIGPPLQPSLKELLKTECEDEAIRCLGFYRERFTDVGLFENGVYEGIPQMLQSLRDLGLRLFVATSKPTTYTTRILDHFYLTQFFDAVYGSELDGTRAAKADLIAFILNSEALKLEETMMVGDREHDVIGARANGLDCIGVSWGYGSREELERAGASQLVGSPGELVQALSEAVASSTNRPPAR